MKSLCSVGGAIEGKKIQGQSRKPLEYKGITLYNDKKVHQYKAKEDVRASIAMVLPPGALQIEPESILTDDHEIICEIALINSIRRMKSRIRVAPGSHTHNANHWSFSRQTAVRIMQAQQAIQNALDKKQKSLE